MNLNNLFEKIRIALKNRYVAYSLVILGVYLVVVFLGRIEAPQKTQLPEETPFNVRETEFSKILGITPGRTNYSEVGPQFGDFVYEDKTQNLDLFFHEKEETAGSYYEFGVSKDGIVKYARIPRSMDVGSDDEIFLSEFQERNDLGDPDLFKYDLKDYFLEAHIYLDEGLILSTFGPKDKIFYITYFEPTTQDEFKSLFGNTLSDIRPQEHGSQGEGGP